MFKLRRLGENLLLKGLFHGNVDYLVSMGSFFQTVLIALISLLYDAIHPRDITEKLIWQQLLLKNFYGQLKIYICSICNIGRQERKVVLQFKYVTNCMFLDTITKRWYHWVNKILKMASSLHCFGKNHNSK